MLVLVSIRVICLLWRRVLLVGIISYGLNQIINLEQDDYMV